MGNCSSTSKCNPCGPNYDAINQLATKTASYARQANTYAVNAENSWLEFNALYLGAFAVAPTVDNEGDPLQVGALYWNTVSNTIFAWNGTAWVENGNFNEFTNFSLPSAAPVPAANLRTGQEYEIVVVGNTNWTTIGAPAAQVGVRFTKNAVAATGTGTARVTRDLVTRFADVVNVKDFGAVGSGAVDDRAAIQAAIDASYGKTLFFPDGTYFISGPINITSGISIVGGGFTYIAGGEFTTFNLTASPGGPVEISNLILFKNSRSTTIVEAIRATSIGALNFKDITVLSYTGGIHIEGCSNSRFENVNVFKGNTTAIVAGSFCFKISQDTAIPTIFGAAFTIMFSNCQFGGDNIIDFCLSINSGDALFFNNCYFGAARIADVFITSEIGAVTTSAITFNNCYLDVGSQVESTNYGIWIKNDGQSNPINTAINFRSCYINGVTVGALIDEPSAQILSFANCEFFYIGATAIQIASAATEADIRITDCSFSNIGYRDGGNQYCIDAQGGKSLNITSNMFRKGQTTPVGTLYGIRLNSTIGQVCIHGNNFLDMPNDFISTATVNQLLVTDNISNNTNSTSLSPQFGNRLNPSNTVLDWYEEITWTPVVNFGGLSTGVTYSSRTGNITRIGNIVNFNCYVGLSSKGTAVGDLQITGLPINQNLSAPGTYTVRCGNLNSAIAESNLDAAASTATSIEISKQSAGNVVVLNNSDFTNTTFFTITGQYNVA